MSRLVLNALSAFIFLPVVPCHPQSIDPAPPILAAPVEGFPEGKQPVGYGSKLWEWSSRQEHLRSVVRIQLEGDEPGLVVAYATGVHVSGGRVLTAHHVVRGQDRKITVVTETGKGVLATLQWYDRDYDICCLKLDEELDVPAAEVGAGVRKGAHVEVAGLGGDSDIRCCVRHFWAPVSAPTTPDQIYADASLIPGDSGGPVFNRNRELVGIVSGGWFWYDGDVKMRSGSPAAITWPLRAAGRRQILRALKKRD